MSKKAAAVALTLALMLAVILAAHPARQGQAEDEARNEFWIWATTPAWQAPDQATIGMAEYLVFLRMRDHQNDLIPLLMHLQSNGLISGFELAEIPPFVKIRTSLLESTVRRVVPTGLNLAPSFIRDGSSNLNELARSFKMSVDAAPSETARTVVWETENIVSGNIGITAQTTVTITVTPAAGSVRSAYTFTTTSDGTGSYWASAPTSPVVRDIAPGDTVVVSAVGAATRSVVIPSMSIRLNLDTQTLSGTKPAGQTSNAWINDYRSKSFAGPVAIPTSGTTYSVASPVQLNRTDYATLNVLFANGNEVITFGHPSMVRVYFHRYQTSSSDKVHGYTTPWTPEALTIWDPQSQVKYAGNVSPGNTGEYWWEASPLGLNISPADRVAVGGMSALEVATISIEANINTDVITATISSGQESTSGRFLRVMINEAEQATRDGTTNSNGKAAVDFSTGAVDGSDIDILYGHFVTVYYEHANGHQSVGIFELTEPTPSTTNRVYIPVIRNR